MVEASGSGRGRFDGRWGSKAKLLDVADWSLVTALGESGSEPPVGLLARV
jgi:hypothetical protein